MTTVSILTQLNTVINTLTSISNNCVLDNVEAEPNYSLKNSGTTYLQSAKTKAVDLVFSAKTINITRSIRELEEAVKKIQQASLQKVHYYYL